MLAKDMHAIFTSFRAVYVSRLGISARQFEESLTRLPEEWEHYHTSYEFSRSLREEVIHEKMNALAILLKMQLSVCTKDNPNG